MSEKSRLVNTFTANFNPTTGQMIKMSQRETNASFRSTMNAAVLPCSVSCKRTYSKCPLNFCSKVFIGAWVSEGFFAEEVGEVVNFFRGSQKDSPSGRSQMGEISFFLLGTKTTNIFAKNVMRKCPFLKSRGRPILLPLATHMHLGEHLVAKN